MSCSVACVAGYQGTPTQHKCPAKRGNASNSVALVHSTQLPTCADVDECASHPCLNGATCADSTSDSKVHIDTFACTCTPQYAGTHCTVLLRHPCVSTPCKHGGTCVESADSLRWSCVCMPSYSGSTCAICVDNPAWSDQYVGDTCKQYAKGGIDHAGCLTGTPPPRGSLAGRY